VNKFMSISKEYPKLQIQAIGLDEIGNGYILFSDENPQPAVLPSDLKNVKIYYSKVENYIPLEEAVLFHIEEKNLTGAKSVITSSIDASGTGFFIYYNEFKVKLWRMDKLEVRTQQELDVFTVSSNNFTLKRSENKNFLSYFDSLTISYTPRKIAQYLRIQPINNHRFDGEPSTSLLFERSDDNLFIVASDIHIDTEGNGLFAMLKRDTNTFKDTLVIYKIEDLLLKEYRAYDYPRYGALRDLKIVVNVSGARLFFMDAPCDGSACSNDQFLLGRSPMQVSSIDLPGLFAP